MKQHGNTTMYRLGCRCRPCSAANTGYHRARREELYRLARIGKAVEQLTRKESK